MMRLCTGIISILLVCILGWNVGTTVGQYTTTFRVGPILVNSGMNGGYKANVEKPPGNFGVTQLHFSLVDDTGRTWNRSQIYLHHAVFYDFNQKDIMCAGEPMRFAAVGGEFSPIIIPSGYAMMFSSSSNWFVEWDILSFLQQDNVPVYVEYTVTYITSFNNVISVGLFWLDVGYCQGSDYNVSAGSGYSVKMANFSASPQINITVVYQLGHLHPGGVNLTLMNENGHIYCMSVPTYSADHEWITHMGACTEVFNIVKDPYFYLESTYQQNPTQPLIDVMGIMLVYAHVWSL